MTTENSDENLSFQVQPNWRQTGITVLLCSILVWLAYSSPLRALVDDGFSRPIEYAFRSAVGADLPLDPRIKMIAFDDRTTGALERPDLTLADWAQIFKYLDQYQPQVIFIDRIFGLPLGAQLNSGINQAEADNFINQIKGLSTPVVVGAFSQDQPIERRTELNRARWSLNLKDIAVDAEAAKQWLSRHPALQAPATHIYGPHPKIVEAFGKVGLINNEGQGFIRPVVRTAGEQVMVHSAVATVGDVSFRDDQFWLADHPLPIGHDGRLIINLSARQAYYDQTDSLLHHIRLINRGERDDHIQPQDIVAILPMMYTGNTDMKDLPIGRLQGSYLNVSAINNALSGSWLTDWPFALSLILLAGGLAGIAANLSQPIVFIPIISIFVLLQAALGLLSFSYWQVILPWSFSATSTILVGGLVFVDMARRTEEQKRFAALKAAEGARVRNLLHVVCHDIANPLMVVATRVEMVGGDFQKVIDTPKEASNLDKIGYAAEKIRNIITSVRELEAAEVGKADVELKPVAISQIFSALRLTFDDRLQRKQLTLNLNEPSNGDIEDPQSLWVTADPVSLENFVINNLVSNAIKFSPDGSTITLNARQAGKEVIIEVIDQGIGIPPNLIDKIFSSSEHTTRPGTNDELGTGFGMPIVHNYVKLFGGSISIASKTKEDSPDDHGTTITIRLLRAED